MAWIRNTAEQPERRPTDIGWLIVAAIGVVVVGVWAQSQSEIDLNFFEPLNQLSSVDGVFKAVYALGSIWALGAFALLLLVLRQVGVAWRVALAGALAWGISELLHEILPAHSISHVTVNVRIGDGPMYPATNVAIVTALAVAFAPYAVRPLRRILFLLILFVALATMYLGAGFPSDALGGILLGITAGAAVLVAFGSPAGRPTIEEVRVSLTDLGYDVADMQRAQTGTPRASVMDVELTSGEKLRVDAFGRDQRDAQFIAKAWHRAMYHEPGQPVFGSRIQQVEHVGYTMMLADRAGVHAARVEKTGIGTAGAAMLVTTPPPGGPLGALAPDTITDATLAAVWSEIEQLHAAGISHGNLDASHILVDGTTNIALDDFTSADASGEEFWVKRDVAAVLVDTAQLVGNDRAIAAAISALGKDRVGEVIPFVQPAALPPGTVDGTKHLGKILKQLRADLVTATGVQDSPPLKIKRLTLVNIGMLAGVLLALVIAFNSIEGIDWASVKSEFEGADWGWVVLAAVMYPLIPMAWATALMGCVTIDLPFVPTTLTQIACSFLNLITPNGIGGTALQLDYLHKEGVPLASGGSAMVLSTGVGGAIQLILFFSAAAITATAVDTSSSSSDNTSLYVIVAVAVVVGIILAIPRIRGKVVPAVQKAAGDIWSVIRNPRKALQLIGGDLAGNLIYPAILGVCLLAFHQRLDFAELIVVQVGAGMVGNVAPVPGGIGVTEAALTAGLTSFGIPAAPALATVLVFRGVTFAIPPIFGFFTLRWLRAKGYA